MIKRCLEIVASRKSTEMPHASPLMLAAEKGTAGLPVPLVGDLSMVAQYENAGLYRHVGLYSSAHQALSLFASC
jgi:hypothetical protein